jgi:hypothetical protein
MSLCQPCPIRSIIRVVATPRPRPPSSSFVAAAALPLALGLALRLFFIHHNPDLSGDPLIYGAIARNLLQHGVYGFQPLAPTLIRLPGYPLFLAACFAVISLFHSIPGSGPDSVAHFYPVLYLQAIVDLGSCLLIARLASRLAPPALRRRAALCTLWLAALCPFTACYTAAPLTEILELFSITAALYAFTRALHVGEAQPAAQTPIARSWLAVCVLAWTYAALLRPDGALLAVVLCPALVLYGVRHGFGRRALRAAALGTLASLLAFTPWALRNWHTFHTFQPLAPRYATDPGEPTFPGFQRWTKSVCADLVCTIEVYWNANDDVITLDSLPSRAFDSPGQRDTTAALLAEYNRTTTLTPALDARFGALAAQRIADHPGRYYFGLPLLRLADMWLRPRMELFNIDPRWWRYKAEGPDTILAWAFVFLNAFYLLIALLGALRSSTTRIPAPLPAVFLSFILLRCALLLTIEAPEPRYTLECFPILFVLGGLWLTRGKYRPELQLH